MSVIRFVVNTAIKMLIRICCRVHDAPLEQVPERGPLITVSNHISFLEAPLLYTHLLPRKLSGFSKVEFWDKPVSRFLFEMWDAIPVHRGEPDLAALRRVLAMLREGYIIAVAPEGTRSHDGQMQRARPGAVTMGLRSGAPFLPIAHYGGEKLKDNLRRLRRTDFHIAVGQPLYVPFAEGITAEGMPPPTPGPFAYEVQTGDTLNAIALRFGADPIEIIEFNNLLSPDSLTVGSEIIIPNYQPPDALTATSDDAETGGLVQTLSDGQFVHIVQSGQGLFEIADIYGVSPDDIALANNMNNTNLLRVGQELIIPGVSLRDAAIQRGSVHIVQSGESMLGIAIRYGVTVEEILELNELANPDSIFEGQELIIPGN